MVGLAGQGPLRRAFHLSRPTSLTDELRHQFVLCIQKGMTPKQATSFCGISYSSWVNWRKRGADGEEPFATLLRDVERAKLYIIDLALDRGLQLLKRGDIKAVKMYLEAFYGERFGQRQNIHITGWIGPGLSYLRELGLENDDIHKLAKELEPIIGADGVAEFLAAAGLGRADPAGPETQGSTDETREDEELPV